VRLWRAENRENRDFRFRSGLRYSATDVPVAPAARGWWVCSVPVPVPARGWSAQFLEVTYPDGLVLTTPVTVWPLRYPDGGRVDYPLGFR
jgi:PhoPQ-activated pathogenicity-related protein